MMHFRSALVAVTLFAAAAHAAPPPAPAPAPTPAPAKPAAVAPAQPAAAPAAPAAAVFPTAISPKYASLKASDARMKTCLDQYKSNKAGNANGGMKWIQKGGGYYSVCSKKLKG